MFDPRRWAGSFLKKRVVKERLMKLRSCKGLPVSGNKDDLIERVMKHYGSFELFDLVKISLIFFQGMSCFTSQL